MKPTQTRIENCSLQLQEIISDLPPIEQLEEMASDYFQLVRGIVSVSEMILQANLPEADRNRLDAERLELFEKTMLLGQRIQEMIPETTAVRLIELLNEMNGAVSELN